MKLKLKLKTTAENGSDIILKLNVAPSKYLGLINFINLVLNQKSSVELGFEKISKSRKIDESKVVGKFSFELKKGAEKQLMLLKEEILSKISKRKKQLQKRKQK